MSGGEQAVVAGPRRVAIVHEYLTQFGGAERVLLALLELFPHAPVFTLVYDRDRAQIPLDESRLRTSFLQRLPGARRHYRYFPLLMPLAIEQFDFSQYDLVLSATHSFAKGIVTGPNTLHVSYCFTPTRYVWDDSHRYVRDFSSNTFFQRLAPVALSYIRLWDYYAAQRVDAYITLSRYVAQRIRKYYHRPSVVVPPPVAIDRFTVSPEHKGYYLIVSRLVPYKRIELAIEACERLGRALWIVGSGQEEALLQSRAGRWTRFLGFVPDAALPDLYAGARALLFPQEEDFGITPLEAAAAGKPTIAFGAGGALETIEPYRTGIFFTEQTVASLMAAIRQFETGHWNPAFIRQHAEKFRREIFLARLRQAIDQAWQEFAVTRLPV
jgi:glycosyltransferase involved in cell wall biosynthesis